MNISNEEYNAVMQAYIDKFGERPPDIGSIYETDTIEYVEWIREATKGKKPINLDKYYPDGANYEMELGVITDGYCEDKESQLLFDKDQKGKPPII